MLSVVEKNQNSKIPVREYSIESGVKPPSSSRGLAHPNHLIPSSGCPVQALLGRGFPYPSKFGDGTFPPSLPNPGNEVDPALLGIMSARFPIWNWAEQPTHFLLDLTPLHAIT
jgi:hypothetical protein